MRACIGLPADIAVDSRGDLFFLEFATATRSPGLRKRDREGKLSTVLAFTPETLTEFAFRTPALLTARDNEAIADVVVKHFKGAREQLNAVGASFRKLPGGIKYPKALEQLERSLFEPVAKAVKGQLGAPMPAILGKLLPSLC